MKANGIARSSLWAFAGLLLAASPLLANGVVRDGLGAISAGRGGTNLGHWDNGSILLDNPAAMTNIYAGEMVDFGIDTVFTDIHYTDPDNDVQAEFKPMPLSQASYIRRSDCGCWAYGVGVFAPAGFAAEYDMEGPAGLPGTHRYKSIGALAKFLPGVAYQVTDRLSIGGTLGLATSHAELEGPFIVQTGPLQGVPVILDLQGTGAALTWSAGVQYHLTERTTLGAAYQSETDFRLDGVGKMTIPPGPTLEYDADTTLVWPRSIGVGMAHQLCSHRRISLDFIYFGWSDSFSELPVSFYDDVLGAAADTVPLHWTDSISVRAGYEHILQNNDIVRLGYVHNSKNIPDSTLTPFIPATLEHTFSAGYGREIGNNRVDLAYQFSWGPEAVVETSDVLGGDFDNSRTEASAHWMYISWQRRY